MTETPLDQAHSAMENAPDDDATRLRFFERFADNELFLLLEEKADGDQIKPRLFPLDDATVALVFDREERLAEFAGGAAPYAAMSGRVVSNLFAGQGIAVGLNLDVAPSAFILPPDALVWLNETLSSRPEETQDTPSEIRAPGQMPEAVLMALDAKLALCGGLAQTAYLCGVSYVSGRRTHLLAFIDPVPGAEPALANAASEALKFSGIEAGAIDVSFFRPSDPVAARLARVGLRFEFPEPEEPHAPSAPGMNPDKPPILR
jgi:hypothetical protein